MVADVNSHWQISRLTRKEPCSEWELSSQQEVIAVRNGERFFVPLVADLIEHIFQKGVECGQKEGAV